MARNTMIQTHKDFALNTAKEMGGKRGIVDFYKIRTMVNRKYKRQYSIYQISGLLGNWGYWNSNCSRERDNKVASKARVCR